MTNDGLVYHALSVHLSRAKLIERSTIDICRGEISSESGKSSGWKYACFCRYLNYLKAQCMTSLKKPPCQNQINSFIPFGITPTCDTQTDRQTQGHSVARVKSQGQRSVRLKDRVETSGRYPRSVTLSLCRASYPGSQRRRWPRAAVWRVILSRDRPKRLFLVTAVTVTETETSC